MCMTNSIVKKYVAYVCNSYNEKSLKRIITVVRNFNNRNIKKLKLVISGLPVIDYLDCEDIINIGFANCDNPYILRSRVIIIDNEKQLKNNVLLEYLHKGIICLVNEECKVLAEMCKINGMGLVYSNDKELLAILEYIEKNNSSMQILKMVYNASGCEETTLIKLESEEIKKRVLDRKSKIKSFLQICDNNISPEEKVRYITRNVMDNDGEIILRCSDRMDFKNKFVELLMIYKYVKLFINPKVKLYFTTAVNVSFSIYHMLKAQIKELTLNDVYFDTVLEDNGIKVIDIKSYYDKNLNAVCIDDNSIEYVAEQIGMLL